MKLIGNGGFVKKKRKKGFDKNGQGGRKGWKNVETKEKDLEKGGDK